MTTELQIAANRQNALLSTGPRTPTGKELIRRNALKHGHRAHTIVLPGESEAEFAKFRERVLWAFRPNDTMEAFLVERLIGMAWRLRRVDSAEDELLAEMCRRIAPPDGVNNEPPSALPVPGALVARLVAANDSAIVPVERHQASLERAFKRTLDEFSHYRQTCRQCTLPDDVQD